MTPELQTPRLTLRAHAPADFEAACGMWEDPAVTRFIGGKPSSAQQTWARLLTYLGHWTAMGYGYWAIEERSTRAFAGEIGFADFKRDISPSMRGIPELGFALVSRFHGRGIAREAATAVLAWGDAHLPSRRTVCLVNEENAASLHLVRMLGYREFDRTRYNGARAVFLERIVR